MNAHSSIDYPTISIVTPSFNQVEYLEAAILSVISQDYPKLEYVVIDGGSSDGSREIIERYAEYLTYWVSEPDQGQYDALNKGFAETTGRIMGWLNSDDKLVPHALSVVGEIFFYFTDIEWISSILPVKWNMKGQAFQCVKRAGFDRHLFYSGGFLPKCDWYASGWIQQESTFWVRSLWEKAGGYVNSDFGLAGDFELWSRFYKYAHLYGVEALLGGFRRHGDQKTSEYLELYIEEAKKVFETHGGKPPSKLHSWLKRLLSLILAHRPMPCGVRPICSFLRRVGLLHQAYIVTWKGNSWQIVTRYIV